MGCKYCELISESSNILYEDDKVIAIIPEKPITKGHIQVISKEHKASLQEFSDKDAEHLFYSASFAATALFENLQAQGTNIILNTGGELKNDGHIHVHVIARMQDDSLNFLWQPKRLPEEDMNSAQSKIKDKCDMIGVEGKKEKVDMDKKPEKLESTEGSGSAASKQGAGETSGTGTSGPIPSEEEQRYGRHEKEEPKDEDKESYLIKQLRRMP